MFVQTSLMFVNGSIGFLQGLRRSGVRSVLLVAAVLWSFNAWACSLHDLRESIGEGASEFVSVLSGTEEGGAALSGHDVRCPHASGAHHLPAAAPVLEVIDTSILEARVVSVSSSLVDLGATAPPTPPPIVG